MSVKSYDFSRRSIELYQYTRLPISALNGSNVIASLWQGCCYVEYAKIVVFRSVKKSCQYACSRGAVKRWQLCVSWLMLRDWVMFFHLWRSFSCRPLSMAVTFGVWPIVRPSVAVINSARELKHYLTSSFHCPATERLRTTQISHR